MSNLEWNFLNENGLVMNDEDGNHVERNESHRGGIYVVWKVIRGIENGVGMNWKCICPSSFVFVFLMSRTWSAAQGV